MATEFVRNNLSCGFEYYIIKHVQSRDCNGEALKMPGWETIKMDTGEILNGLLENLSNLTYIKAEDIPNIDLYGPGHHFYGQKTSCNHQKSR